MIVELPYFILVKEENNHVEGILMFAKMTLKRLIKNTKKIIIGIHLYLWVFMELFYCYF